ncbi:MAG: hypothetical protein ACREDZ_13720, partial [Kiloniellales bacterium]
MSNRLVFLVMAMGVLTGSSPPAAAQDMMAKYSDTSGTSFSLQVVAPKDQAREYAFCKVVWFAESRKVESVSLSQPSYGDLSQAPQEWTLFNTDPAVKTEEWTVMTTIAYLPDDPQYADNY